MIRGRARALGLAVILGCGGSASAQTQAEVKAASPAVTTFLYVGREIAQQPPRSLEEPVVADYGWQGARFGVSELNANGRFLGQRFELERVVLAAGEDLRTRIRGLSGKPAALPTLIVADLEATDLLTLADLREVHDSVIIDGRTSDDALRHRECRRNVFHVLPSWEMRAAALGQFLLARGWRRWLLLSGATADDLAYDSALRHEAAAAGATIVRESPLPGFGAENSWTQAQIDARIEALTKTAVPYDMVLVTDSSATVGERVMFNTAAPRPVAGTQGLTATAWDPQFRDFAARGFGYRFTQFASREMSERDYGNWLAVTVLGEAVLRGGAHDGQSVRQYLRSSRFSVAAFKGEPLTFRSGDQQLRQPILLFGPRALIALSPEDERQSPGRRRAADGLGECDLQAASGT